MPFDIVAALQKGDREVNKTERLLAILLELQRYPQVRAQDLADKFEISIRTIYRDMQALSESGVPLFGSPGQGYALMEGYFLPPVSLNVNEAVAALLGTEFVKQHFGGHYTREAELAADKLESVLPAAVRMQSAAIRNSIRLIGTQSDIVPEDAGSIPLICEAISARQYIQFRYAKPGTAASDLRIVAPYGVVLTRTFWMLVGYCMQRQEIRHFRLSRMLDLHMQEQTFEWPEGFTFGEYQPPDDRHVQVVLRVSEQVATRLKEGGSFYFDHMTETDEGNIATLRVRRIQDVLLTIIGWGSGAVVVEPEELRVAIRQELQHMLKSY